MEKSSLSLNYKIAITAVFGALSIILSFTPLGYIQLGGLIAITIMHIPVILAAILGGLWSGLGVSLVFGLSSLIRAVTAGTSPFFLNPAVSILPRLLIPIFSWGIFTALDAIPHFPKTISGAISAAIGTLTNTVFVMGAIYIFYGKELVNGMSAVLERLGFSLDVQGLKGYFAILFCTLATNGIWEIIAAVVLCTAVLGSVFAVKNKKSKISRSLESESNENADREK